MAPHRPARVSSRLVRKYLLVAAAVTTIILAACAPALADEPPPTPTMPPLPAVTAPPDRAALTPVAQAPAPAPITPAETSWHRYQRPRERSQWYGWQTLIADGASILVVPTVGARMGTSGETIGYLAVGGYLLGAPVVHLAHERPGVAAASLGLRVGMPLGGAFLGMALQGKCRGDFCGLGGPLIGGALGIIGAIVLDAAAFSYEKAARDEDDAGDGSSRRRAAQRERLTRTPDRVALVPVLGPRAEGGFDAGVGGAF